MPPAAAATIANTIQAVMLKALAGKMKRARRRLPAGSMLTQYARRAYGAEVDPAPDRAYIGRARSSSAVRSCTSER